MSNTPPADTLTPLDVAMLPGPSSETSFLGIGFFVQNSVLYNLAGQQVGYSPNFVTDANITTTTTSPLVARLRLNSHQGAEAANVRAALDRRGSAFGGSNTQRRYGVGSNNVTASTFGFASGMGGHVSPSRSSALRLPERAPVGASLTPRAKVVATPFRSAVRRQLVGPAYLAGALVVLQSLVHVQPLGLRRSASGEFLGQSSARGSKAVTVAALPAFGDDALRRRSSAGFQHPGL